MAEWYCSKRDIRYMPLHIQAVSGLIGAAADIVLFAITNPCTNRAPIICAAFCFLLNLAIAITEGKNNRLLSYPLDFTTSTDGLLTETEQLKQGYGSDTSTYSQRATRATKKTQMVREKAALKSAIFFSLIHPFLSLALTIITATTTKDHHTDKFCEDHNFKAAHTILFTVVTVLSFILLISNNCTSSAGCRYYAR